MQLFFEITTYPQSHMFFEIATYAMDVFRACTHAHEHPGPPAPRGGGRLRGAAARAGPTEAILRASPEAILRASPEALKSTEEGTKER